MAPACGSRTTWYGQRISGVLGVHEQDAANKAALHADTPYVAHADVLGRTFLTVAHNKLERNGVMLEERYATRTVLDIEGNQRKVIDAKGRIVMRYDYDMLGNPIYQASMEAGQRWMLNDVAGRPICAWDSRGFTRRIIYDELRRPTSLFVTENGAQRLVERSVYGESQPIAETKNLRGKVFQVFDAAGVVTSEGYDFKGNLLQSKRELLPDYKTAVDWQQDPAPTDGTFTTCTTYDALNRPLTVITPDNCIYRPTFNEANLLDKVDVKLRGAASATSFVTSINYNAKGQRELIAYGNGAKTVYEYDLLSFRLTSLKTTRGGDVNGFASQLFSHPTVVQDLHYTYDAAGNITRIEDAALKTIFHNGQQVEPICDYTYDGIYRLIEASGREHIGQAAHDFNPQNRRDFDFAGFADFITHPNDLQALRRYSERYEYDAVGNFESKRHIANGGSWTRDYEYNAGSLIEEGKKNNRLTKTRVGNSFTETYGYTDALGNDVHGCMTAINSMQMGWDFKDQLQRVNLGGGGVAYYVYDAAGQRVRKVIETQSGTLSEQRLYLGGFELYQRFGTNPLVRETLHIMDDRKRIALVETKTIENGTPVNTVMPVQRYELGNHLGSACVELDEDGSLISYEEYHPYGTTAFQAINSAAEVSVKRYRYTGTERDEETGLVYYRARYYAPWLGRWGSADPAGLIDGTNLYRFVQDSPLRLTDPTGRKPAKITFISPDDVPHQHPEGEKVNAPKVEGADARDVTVIDVEKQHTEKTKWGAVRSSPAYVDNFISVGATIDNIAYLNITALNYRYAGRSDLSIPIGALDLKSQVPAYEFIKIDGTIYPLSSQGTIAFNEPNTPKLLAGARMKLGDRLEALNYREEVAWLVYVLSGAVAELGGHASSMGEIHAVGFSLGRKIGSRSPSGGGGGERVPPQEGVRPEARQSLLLLWFQGTKRCLEQGTASL